MERLLQTGIRLRKAIAMGLHDDMYSAKGGKKSPKAAKGKKSKRMGRRRRTSKGY